MTSFAMTSTRSPFLKLLFPLVALLFVGCSRSEVDSASSGAIPYNTKIVFGQGGNSEPLKVTGWSKTEEKFTWTEGTSAQLRVQLPPANEPVVLKVKMAALTKQPELPTQSVEVYINNQKIVEWHVADSAEFTAPMPNTITKAGGPVLIEFRTPQATSPKALGLSADPRILGVCCVDLEFSKG